MIKCKGGTCDRKAGAELPPALALPAGLLGWLAVCPGGWSLPLCSLPSSFWQKTLLTVLWDLSWEGKSCSTGFCLYGCVSKNKTAVCSSSLCVLSTASGFRSLPYGQVFFLYSKYGSCSRDFTVTRLLKLLFYEYFGSNRIFLGLNGLVLKIQSRSN